MRMVVVPVFGCESANRKKGERQDKHEGVRLQRSGITKLSKGLHSSTWSLLVATVHRASMGRKGREWGLLVRFINSNSSLAFASGHIFQLVLKSLPIA